MENCKTCKWLDFYDWYRCGNEIEDSHDEEFIRDIENTKCPNYEKREGKFWIGKDGEF